MIQARLFRRFGELIAAIVAVAFCAVLNATPLHAQAVGEANNLSAELVAESAPVAGETITVALHFQPVSPEWHGYWSNPGDAGLGMQLDWQLPEGWEAGEPLYPVPKRLVIADLMNHIYEGDYAVLIPIKVPNSLPGDDAIEISLKAQWLACTDKICVPEDGEFQLRLPRNGERADTRFSAWRAAIAPMLDRQGTFEITNDRLRVSIPIPDQVELTEPHVFVANERLVAYSAIQTFFRTDDAVVAEIPLRKGERVAPDELQAILAFSDQDGVRLTAVEGPVPVGGMSLRSADEVPSLWLLALGALAGGLILNVMPCVFPILAIKALSLAKAGTSESVARRDGLAYTAGVISACVALGCVMLLLRAAGEQVGWAFQLQSPGIVVALLLLAVVITANFAGLFELPSVAITGTGEPASAFGTGLLAAFVATPCTGPFMAAALGAALLLPPIPALVLFALLGLGLALPFLALGFIPALRRKLPKPGTWMGTFRKAMAIPMGLTALALVWLTTRLGGQGFALVALVVVFGLVIALGVVGRLQRVGKMAWPAFGLVAAPFLIFGAFALPSAYSQDAQAREQSILAAKAFSKEALAEARKSGQPVFLWFTADWCLTCKVNEQVAIEREATKAAFESAGVVPMVGDWTRRDVEITEFLTDQGVAGVPLYLWYGPGEPAEQLPQVLTPDMLIERAQQDRE